MYALLTTILSLSPPAEAARAKDLGSFHGVRDNTLTGAGLVVGLRRTGDSPRNAASIRALANRLQGHGLSLAQDEITSRNVAMVMVTATLGPDTRSGSRVDVLVASSGDASSLEGGVLLMTPLFGTDGEVHATAEGALVVGGYAAAAGLNLARKNTPTVGRIPGGAIVEVGSPSIDYGALETIDFVLRDPDFTTATRLADAIDADFGQDIATPTSSSTIALAVPEDYRGQFPAFAARVESVEVQVDAPARVVVNERTGTVVMGADVRIAPVAIAHGGLTIEVRRRNAVSQPAPFSNGTTAVQSNTFIEAEEAEGRLTLVEGVAIGELVAALNELGVRPRDLIQILEAIRSSGALHAEIVTH